MALSTQPVYPVENESTVITETSALGDVQVIEITSKPSLSQLVLGYQILSSPISPTSIFQIATAGLATDTVVFDERGEYGIRIFDLRVFEGSASYPLDPAGSSHVKLLGIASYTLNVSAYADLAISTEIDAAVTIRVLISNETIRAAELQNFSTDKGREVALKSAVIAGLAGIVGKEARTIGDELYDAANDLRAKYELHRVNAIAHPAPARDLTNVIQRTDATSNSGAIELVNELRDKILKHLKNGSHASVPWHAVDDLRNIPLIGTASDLASATVLLCDLRERVYERHQLQTSGPACHPGAGTNPLTAAGYLDTLIVAYLDGLSEVDPTAPAGEVDGAVAVAHKFGFKRYDTT